MSAMLPPIHVTESEGDGEKMQRWNDGCGMNFVQLLLRFSIDSCLGKGAAKCRDLPSSLLENLRTSGSRCHPKTGLL